MPSRLDDLVSQRLQVASTPLALLREAAAARPTHPALVLLRDVSDRHPVTVTYAALLQEVEAAASAFRASGLAPSEAVALLMPAMPEGVTAFIAATTAGVVFPINLLLSSEALAVQLRLARARVAVVLGPRPGFDFHGRVSEATVHGSELSAIIEVPYDGKTKCGASWPDFIASAPVVTATPEAPDRAAALFHTGGSTGAPKLAELSLRNLAAGAMMSAAATGLRPDDRVLCGLPLFHVAGAIDVVLAAIAVGATVIFPTVLGARDPEVMRRIWSAVDETRASILALVPTSLASAASASRDGAHLRSLRVIATGGSPCAPQLVRKIETLTGRAVAQVYGMTEASGIIASQPFDGVFREPAVGYIAPLVQLRIGQSESGGAAQPRGEVCWTGPNRFIGYRTLEALAGRAEQWIASGDLGEFGADGQLRLLGRMKDVIIRSGHNIDPALIEETAQGHPDVRLAAAVPIPDAYAGELPLLYVALHEGATCTPDDIAGFIAAHIAEPPARPARVLVLPELPLTPLGKVARYKLRQAAALLRAREALAGHAVEAVSCSDPLAKRIDVAWQANSVEEERARAVAILGELGLTLVQL